MTNIGSPDNAPVPPGVIEAPITRRERAISAVALVGVAALVALALFAGFHAVSILYGVIYPPDPPIFDHMTQVSHESEEHGVDTWRYLSDSTPDEIASFYRDQGANCQYRAPHTAYVADSSVGMTCDAITTFSIFSMNYEVVITPEKPDNVVIVSREVYWIGSPPAAH